MHLCNVCFLKSIEIFVILMNVFFETCYEIDSTYMW